MKNSSETMRDTKEWRKEDWAEAGLLEKETNETKPQCPRKTVKEQLF
jgi:hypothetical protein